MNMQVQPQEWPSQGMFANNFSECDVLKAFIWVYLNVLGQIPDLDCHHGLLPHDVWRWYQWPRVGLRIAMFTQKPGRSDVTDFHYSIHVEASQVYHLSVAQMKVWNPGNLFFPAITLLLLQNTWGWKSPSHVFHQSPQLLFLLENYEWFHNESMMSDHDECIHIRLHIFFWHFKSQLPWIRVSNHTHLTVFKF